jgi:hypothetical protein
MQLRLAIPVEINKFRKIGTPLRFGPRYAFRSA